MVKPSAPAMPPTLQEISLYVGLFKRMILVNTEYLVVHADSINS